MIPIPMVPNRGLAPILADWWKGSGPLRKLAASGFLRPLHAAGVHTEPALPKNRAVALSDEPSSSSLDLSGLFSDLFDELSARAEMCIHRFRSTAAWQTNELVNEAFVRLQSGSRDEWDSRMHFVKYSARVMRSVVVDDLRGSTAGAEVEELTSGAELEVPSHVGEDFVDLEALDLAMKQLAIDHPLMAKAIEMRFSQGHEMQDIAETLAMPKRTLERRWQAARTWLQTRLAS